VQDPAVERAKLRRLPFGALRKNHGVRECVGLKAEHHFLENWGVLLFVGVAGVVLALLGILAFDPLPWEAWMAFAITVLTLASLIKGTLPTEVSILAGVTALLAFFIITPQEALVGFSSTGVATVVVLFMMAEGVQRTSVLRPLLRFMLGKPTSMVEAQLRLWVPAAMISAFLSNTPVVAMLMPFVMTWSRSIGIPASKLLMPMNFAVMLGGTCTLLGTSTNMVVVGLASTYKVLDPKTGQPLSFSIFGITPLGVPYAAVGLIYLFIATRFILKVNRGAVDNVIRNPREYTVAVMVTENAPIIGETILQAGLRGLEGLFLVEIIRADGECLNAPGPETRVAAGDIMLFAGQVETVNELYQMQGLVPAAGDSRKINLERHKRRLVELVVSPSSSLVGMTVKESRFRTRFNAAIIAVHRQGEHVKEKMGNIVLRSGDVLLIETGEHFMCEFQKDPNFALVCEVSGSQPPREDKLHMFIAAALVLAMIGVATARVMPLLTAALLCVFGMLVTQCMTLANAGSAVNISVILTIALSFGISKGLEVTGAAAQLADFIVQVFDFSTVGLLFGIYLGTALLTSVITNNAAVALMFPIVADPVTGIIVTQGLNPYAALYTMTLAASAAFATPIGYQTNLMVHGPGGYKFTDWVKFGLPMQFVLGAAGVFLAAAIFP